MSGGLRISCFDACALQEDDTRRFWTKPLGRYFNPRPPCGGRPGSFNVRLGHDEFQSTSSVWRTTNGAQNTAGSGGDFNPRPPCGGRPGGPTRKVGGADFNPRPPCGGRLMPRPAGRGTFDFNPRPPCGGRRAAPWPPRPSGAFQSTSSVWRTTNQPGQVGQGRPISIHVLRVEDDLMPRPAGRGTFDFNPRPPCGGRPGGGGVLHQVCDISIHVLRVEDDWASLGRWLARQFQSTSSVWRTTRRGERGRGKVTQFQSTSSVWRTTAKTEKNLYLHSYNTAICTNLQPKHSAYAFVCTDKDKQSHEKLVRSIRVRSARFTFARPSSPDGALRKSERHPAGRRGELRCVQPCFGNGCPAGKSAGCPLPGRSVWSARP